MSDVPSEAIELFRGPPEAFIAARDELVRQLRETGRDEEAGVVKALRKPTLTAWALNQLAAADPEGVVALLDAGAELRAAQQAATSSGRHVDRLREATAARRAAVVSLRAAAAARLAEAGHAAHDDEIAAALEAASLDPGAAQRLRFGTFERAPEAPAGFGDVFGLTSVPTGRAAGPRGRRPPARDDRPALRAEVARLRRDRAAGTSRAAKAREAADRASRRLEEERARLERLREAHAEAEAAAEAADLDLRRVDRSLAETTGRLDAAERRDR